MRSPKPVAEDPDTVLTSAPEDAAITASGVGDATTVRRPRPAPVGPGQEVNQVDQEVNQVDQEVNQVDHIDGDGVDTSTRQGPVRIEPTGAGRPRKRRRGLFAGLGLLVVVLLAAGVAFGVPPVAHKLGLRPVLGPNTSDPAAPITASPVLKAANVNAPEPSAQGVRAALAKPASNPALGTVTGTVIDADTGATLWNHASSTPLTPASTNKLLTAAATLLSVDPESTLDTKVVAGSEPGTVVIVGGGDPTLNSLPAGQDNLYPGSAHLDDLVAQVKKATGGKVSKVLVDDSAYTGDTLAPGWDSRDIAGGSLAPIVPAMLDGGRTVPTADETKPRFANPSGQLINEFARRIGASPGGRGSAPANAKVLGEVHSVPVSGLIDNMLQISDNVLAEALGRRVAKANGQPESFAGASSSVRKVLQDNGFDVSGVNTVDTSGLSTQDKVPASLLASILKVAAAPDGGDARTAKLRPLLEGLPVAGGTGTLSSRYHDAQSGAGKGWVRAKTGTLSNVNTLAGVVLDADNRVLVFALMSNGSDVNGGREALD
ncbi:MAG: D-alanyl-D-alanine carboxypeptidase/D-alanyl-D-alanine-endopeptidase, partial [Sciscionella sp.]|nr:D-alanyl-D-alanine carboxypeptidase/D-alanyl-D-alanine-endopeptidase [Sciscionella sp.]